MCCSTKNYRLVLLHKQYVTGSLIVWSWIICDMAIQASTYDVWPTVIDYSNLRIISKLVHGSYLCGGDKSWQTNTHDIFMGSTVISYLISWLLLYAGDLLTSLSTLDGWLIIYNTSTPLKTREDETAPLLLLCLYKGPDLPAREAHTRTRCR